MAKRATRRPINYDRPESSEAWDGPFQDVELVAEGEVLQFQCDAERKADRKTAKRVGRIDIEREL